MTRSVLLLGALLVLPGCFRYTPVEPGAVTPRTTVRAHLSDAGAARHQAVLGLDDASLEGTVAGVDNGEIRLLTGGVGLRGEAPVVLTWSEIDGLERRSLDWARTLLLAAGGVAAGVAILEVAGGEASPGGDGGGPRDFSRIPLLRVPVP